MGLANLFVGKNIRELLPLIKDANIEAIAEITNHSDLTTKLEPIKRAVQKPSSKNYLIIVFKF